MKILMLTTNSSLMDGINRHILNISPALNRLKEIEVAVCTVFPRGDLNVALEEQGVKSFSLNAKNGHEFKIIPSYYKVMRTFAPDVVHIHVMALMERIVSTLCFRSVKYVRTIHGIADKVEKVTLHIQIERIFEKIFLVPSSAVCYISNGVKEALQDNATKCISDVVYNPINFNAHCVSSSALHELLHVSTDIPIIGTSCRIAKVKQPELFTEVMCRVLVNNSDVHAVVIGGGDNDLTSACKSIVEKFGVNERFHWLGYRKDAPQLVEELKCFVLTSISEGLPTSLLECMFLKTPFAFLEGNGGLQDIASLNEQFGPFAITAKSGDINGLASGICTLLNTPNIGKIYAEVANKVGKQNFDIENIVMKLNSIYQRVIS